MTSASSASLYILGIELFNRKKINFYRFHSALAVKIALLTQVIPNGIGNNFVI
jgi:hypothetical protein